MNGLRQALAAVGESVVHCCQGCAGVYSNRAEGVLPRGLVFDPNRPDSGLGCIVIGQNPGPASAREMSRLENGTYRDLVEFFSQDACGHLYHRRVRSVVTRLGFDGPLYWTDLVKCQSLPGAVLPLQTLRVCSSRYLRAEVTLLPGAWPIFAVGLATFERVALVFPERTVLGLPHPSGRNRGAAAFYRASSVVEPLQLEENAGPIARWLGPVEGDESDLPEALDPEEAWT